MATIDEYLAAARARLDRVSADDLDAEMAAGALVVDIRPDQDRSRFGGLPGAVIIQRNVLEWRLAPSSDARVFDVAGRRVILFCNDGYQSSLAAAVLLDIGVADATDVIGGFNAYRGVAGACRRPPGTGGR